MLRHVLLGHVYVHQGHVQGLVTQNLSQRVGTHESGVVRGANVPEVSELQAVETGLAAHAIPGHVDRVGAHREHATRLVLGQLAEDLDDSRCERHAYGAGLGFAQRLGPFKTWTFTVRDDERAIEQQVPVHVRVSTTTPESAVQAALAGVGLVQATTYQVAPHVAEGRLVPVLAAYDSEPVPVSLVYPSKRLIPLKLRALLDFAVARLEQRLTLVDALMSDR
jgi:DNA-binding transcriptional LysR family regulator